MKFCENLTRKNLFCNLTALNDTMTVSFTQTTDMDISEDSDLKYSLEMTRLVVTRAAIPFIVCFGCIGNVVNILILTRPCMKSSTNFYLTVLSIYDTVHLVMALTLTLRHYGSISTQIEHTIYETYVARPLVNLTSSTSVWITLTFTIERYIAVCYPMKGKAWCTTKRAKYITSAVCLLAFVLTFPHFFEFTMKEVSIGNNTNYRVVQSAMGESESYRFGYLYLNQALFTFLPLGLLMIFNTLLVRTVVSAAKVRRKLSLSNRLILETSNSDRQSKDQNKITLMLIMVVVVFLVCQLPQAITMLYVVYVDATDSRSNRIDYIFRIAGNIFNLLVMINCAINFILYSSFSIKFRTTFKRMFCKCVSTSLVSTYTFDNKSQYVQLNVRGSLPGKTTVN